jgi:recombination protein RecA
VKAALSKRDLVSAVKDRFSSQFQLREKPVVETIPTGLREVDSIIDGIPRGAITEIVGPASSGRTSLMLSLLAESTLAQETCALVDASDSLDTASASIAGIDLEHLLWIRCSSNVEHAFKSVDLLLQSGGFGLVILDLGDIPISYTSRIVSSWWFRFRRAVEDTRTSLVVVEQKASAKSASSLILNLKPKRFAWSQTPHLLKEKPPPSHPISNLLSGAQIQVERQKPVFLSEQKACFAASTFYQAG